MTTRAKQPRAAAVLAIILCGVAACRASAQDTAPQTPTGSEILAPAPVVADPAEPAAKAVEQSAPEITITTPRQLLRLYGIDDSFFDRLIDGRPVDSDENETLLKVMFRMREFPKADLARWARPRLDVPELLKQPEAARGEVFRLYGRVTEIEVLHPLPEVIERYEFDRYYRCRFVLERHGQPAVVFTRTVPKAWEEGGPIDQPAGAYGVLLKFAGDAEQPVPVFAAPRVAWYPDTLLGKLGMDVGLLDGVQNRRGLTGPDREAFYQMLAAMGRAKPGSLLRQARQQLKTADQKLVRTDKDGKQFYSVVPLFNQPDAQRGRLAALCGTARRVLRIPVTDPDVRQRFGIDHYYNIYLFTEDSQSNPVVFCVRELPPGMPTGDAPQYAEYVEVAGFFFKTWAYRVPSIALGPDSPESGRRMQLAPLLIGARPVWFPRETPADNALVGAIAGGLFVVTLIGIWLALWRYGRGDRKFHRRALAKQFAMDSGISLDEIGLQADGKPDFSGLEEMERRAAE